MLFISISFTFLVSLLMFSPVLMKWGWMTGFQQKKLKILLFRRLPKELINFLYILVSVASVYVVFYFFSGDLKQMTEVDLSKLTVYLYQDSWNVRFDDFGLKYSLSGWWNILFLSMWLNLMWFLYKIIDHFRFPYSGVEYSGYSLLIFLTTAMAYFSYVGGAPFYGFAYNIILLVSYTLAHLLICFLLWFLGAKKV